VSTRAIGRECDPHPSGGRLKCSACTEVLQENSNHTFQTDYEENDEPARLRNQSPARQIVSKAVSNAMWDEVALSFCLLVVWPPPLSGLAQKAVLLGTLSWPVKGAPLALPYHVPQ